MIFSRLVTMEEAFRKEKEESDRLLRKQKLEYESKIVELQKQVMETSMSQSMLSSILSSSGLMESSLFQQQTLHEDLLEADHETLSCKCRSSAAATQSNCCSLCSDCSWSEQDYQLAW